MTPHDVFRITFRITAWPFRDTKPKFGLFCIVDDYVNCTATPQP